MNAGHPRRRSTGKPSINACSALRAEFIRIRTLPWVPMLFGAIVLATLLPAFFAGTRIHMSMGQDVVVIVTQPLGLTFSVHGFVVLAATITGAAFRSGELWHAMIALPHRGALAGSKLVMLLLLTTFAATSILLADGAIRMHTDPAMGWSTADASTWRIVAGFLFSALTFSTLAAALTVLLRNVMAAVALVVMVRVVLGGWLHHTAPEIWRLLPYEASGTVIATAPEQPGAVVTGFIVLAAWLVISAITYLVLLMRRP